MSRYRFFLLFILLILAAPPLPAGQLPAGQSMGGGPHPDFKPTITRSEAVRALRHYQEDPIRNLESAEKFMTFISEDGSAHVSMTPRVLPWMFRSYPPAYVQAVLLAAYVAGNFQSQLDDGNVLDDPSAGLKYVVEVYELLRIDDPSLHVPELDELLAQKERGRLEQAIQAMVDEAPREYEDTLSEE